MTTAHDPVHLLRAIHRAEFDDLKQMIAGGADVDAQSDGWSPAMQACGDGQIKALRILIAAGADLNASGERGMTPLMVAAQENDEPCLAALLKAGVDLEKKDDLGHTAGWFASAYEATECLGRLLKAGGDLDACLVGPVASPCSEAIAAERARREKAALSKAASKTKASVKPPRM